MRRLPVDPNLAQEVVDQTARVYATFAIAVGLVTIIGGETRWSAEAYETALAVPGAPASWGILILALGAVMLYGALTARRRTLMAGSIGCAFWCMFFGVTFFFESYTNPRVGPLGAIIWGTFAILYLMRFQLYRRKYA